MTNTIQGMTPYHDFHDATYDVKTHNILAIVIEAAPLKLIESEYLHYLSSRPPSHLNLRVSVQVSHVIPLHVRVNKQTRIGI